MNWKNTQQRYGLLAIGLHWVMALIVIVLTVIGLYMTSQPESDDKWALYSPHKALGLLIFVLVIGRVLWRQVNVTPQTPPNLTPIEISLARITHASLYAVMFLLPITGYIDSCAGDYKLHFFGLFNIPKLLPQSQLMEDIAVILHSGLGYLCIFLFVLHVAAVLKHHVILKDDVLRRMLPERKGE